MYRLYSEGKYKMFRTHNPQDNYVRFSGRKTCEMWKAHNTLAKKLSKSGGIKRKVRAGERVDIE